MTANQLETFVLSRCLPHDRDEVHSKQALKQGAGPPITGDNDGTLGVVAFSAHSLCVRREPGSRLHEP